MQLTILRGSSQIGGSCVQVSTSSTTILLDLGSPLHKDKIPVDISARKIDAVIVSHSHLDHYGQLNILSEETHIYMGRLTKLLIDGISLFSRESFLCNPVFYFKDSTSFYIGDIKITPYLIDHSAPDSYCFLIEADNKKIFYTGDFRFTGYKGFLLKKIIKKLSNKLINVMLIEGTCLNRFSSDLADEKSVSKKIEETIRFQTNSSFLVSASANIDRLVSASLACDNTGKIFVIDIYTAWLLEQMKSFSKAIPLLDRNHVRVLSKGKYATSQYLKIKGKEAFAAFIKKIYSKSNVIEILEIEKCPTNYLIKLSASNILMLADSLATKVNPVNIIYSMWRGYPVYNELSGISSVNIIYAHTSGHANEEFLCNFATSINPEKLIPIHTEFPERLASLLGNVELLKDKQEYHV